MRRLILIILLSMTTISYSQVKTPEVMARILMDIGDSVNQVTLNPIEKYNRFSSTERSYLGFTADFNNIQSPNTSNYRIELFHKVGFYVSLPYGINRNLNSNTTLEEISYAEQIAELQGIFFPKTQLIESSDVLNCFDYGLNFAPWSKHPIFKNLYLSAGISSIRSRVHTRYSNNNLLAIQGDFHTLSKSVRDFGGDFSIRYVLPYLQGGIGYETAKHFNGLYYLVGINIPLKVKLDYTSRFATRRRFEKKLNQTEQNAKDFNRSNFK